MDMDIDMDMDMDMDMVSGSDLSKYMVSTWKVEPRGEGRCAYLVSHGMRTQSKYKIEQRREGMCTQSKYKVRRGLHLLLRSFSTLLVLTLLLDLSTP